MTFNIYLNSKPFCSYANLEHAKTTARNALLGNNNAFVGALLPESPRKVTLTEEDDRGRETLLAEYIR